MNTVSKTACAVALLLNAAHVVELRADSIPFQRPMGAADPDDPLVVAGFRALFTCSAHFLMGRPLADILEVELADTAGLDLPDPEIDKERLLVRASGGGVEQIAVYRDTMGCTVLPPHRSEADASGLPYVEYAPRSLDPETDYPDGRRMRVDQKAGAPLAATIDRAFSQSYGENTVTTAVIVLREGQALAERYRDGFGPDSGYRTWSTAKTISAAIVGIAVGEGLLKLDEPAPIPEWADGNDPRGEITLANLLHMASGLMSAGSNTNAMYFGGQDVVSAATSAPLEAEPGTRWQYANNDTLLALRALRHRLDDDLAYLRYPYDKLLRPIGMLNTRVEIDHLGNFIGSSQIYTTARDLARFGLLLANDGVWNGKRILPAGWVDFMTRPAPMRETPPGEWGYGAQTWLLDDAAGLPKGAYTSAGNKGQFVTVVPSVNLVVVRTGVDPQGVRFPQDRFVADLLAALSQPDDAQRRRPGSATTR